MKNPNHTARDSAYWIWRNMKRRCHDPRCRQYPHYGARGIKVCQRWFYSFEAFIKDMGPRPHGGTIDRIDNAAGYCPENCRWADMKDQNNNRRRHLPISEKAKQAGLDYALVVARLKKGWPQDLALALPVMEAAA